MIIALVFSSPGTNHVAQIFMIIALVFSSAGTNHVAQIFVIIALFSLPLEQITYHRYSWLSRCFLFRWNKSRSTDICHYRAVFSSAGTNHVAQIFVVITLVFSSAGTNHVAQIFVIIALVFSSAETNHVAQIFVISALFFLPLEQIIFHRYSWL